MHDEACQLANLGGEVLDLDLRGGAWVAAVQESPGYVFAAWEGGRSSTQRVIHPIIRRAPGGRVLLVDARTSERRSNGWWLGADEDSWHPVFVGDAVQDLAVVPAGAAVAYFDEAFDGTGGHHGFELLAEDGSTIWCSEDAGLDVLDVYCMCSSRRGEVLFVGYPSWVVARLDVEGRTLRTTRLPESVAGPCAVTTLDDRLCVHGIYGERDALFAWREGRSDAHFLGTYPGPLRGIGQGRFLARGAHGYAVVDVSEELRRLD